MQIKTQEVYTIIDSISAHYKANIFNRFTRNALTMLVLDNSTWQQIEELTEKTDNYRYQGYDVDELYLLILAMARFVSAARKQGVAMVRYNTVDKISSQDKVFRDMVVNNFDSNLNILADLVHKLYVKVVDYDKSQAKGRRPIYTKYHELNEIGRYLITG